MRVSGGRGGEGEKECESPRDGKRARERESEKEREVTTGGGDVSDGRKVAVGGWHPEREVKCERFSERWDTSEREKERQNKVRSMLPNCVHWCTFSLTMPTHDAPPTHRHMRILLRGSSSRGSAHNATLYDDTASAHADDTAM